MTDTAQHEGRHRRELPQRDESRAGLVSRHRPPPRAPWWPSRLRLSFTVGVALGAAAVCTLLAIAFFVIGPDTPPAGPSASLSTQQQVLDDRASAERDRVDAAPRTYEIRSGDSLWTIAHDQLGDGARWQEIAWINHLQPSTTLTLGRKVILPRR